MQTNPSQSKASAARAWTVGVVLVFALLVLPGLCVVGVTGYFRLGSETAALRETMMSSVKGHWEKKIELNVGWFTTAVARTFSRAIILQPEPRAALEAVRGVEVGVFELAGEPGAFNPGAVLLRADQALKRRGWQRIVGVTQEHQLVAIYMPSRETSQRDLKCCLMVFEGRQLVVVSARGKVEPLLAIAEKHLPAKFKKQGLVL